MFDFSEALQWLRNGDFTTLAPLLEPDAAGNSSAITRWMRQGCFTGEERLLAEALSAACFNGIVRTVEELVDAGVDPLAGNNTGLDAFHWAVNRGQLAVVQLLLARGVPTTSISAHDTTLLGTALWSSVHEPKPDHRRIIEVLKQAGAT